MIEGHMIEGQNPEWLILSIITVVHHNNISPHIYILPLPNYDFLSCTADGHVNEWVPKIIQMELPYGLAIHFSVFISRPQNH